MDRRAIMAALLLRDKEEEEEMPTGVAWCARGQTDTPAGGDKAWAGGCVEKEPKV